MWLLLANLLKIVFVFCPNQRTDLAGSDSNTFLESAHASIILLQVVFHNAAVLSFMMLATQVYLAHLIFTYKVPHLQFWLSPDFLGHLVQPFVLMTRALVSVLDPLVRWFAELSPELLGKSNHHKLLVSQYLECWGAWDTICRYIAKDSHQWLLSGERDIKTNISIQNSIVCNQ